jgi:hypothetical protein
MARQSKRLVFVGQVWRDNDPRVKRRYVTVLQVDLDNARVDIRRCTERGEKVCRDHRRWTDMRRFGSNSTKGFTLVSA